MKRTLSRWLQRSRCITAGLGARRLVLTRHCSTSGADVSLPSAATHLGSDEYSDFVVVVNGARHPVVSALLRMRSEKFREVYSASDKEWSIDVADVKPEDVSALLRHIYGEPLQPTAASLQGLWNLAKALDIPHIPPALERAAPKLFPTSTELLDSGLYVPEILDAIAAGCEVKEEDAGRLLNLAAEKGCDVLATAAANVTVRQCENTSQLKNLTPINLAAILGSDQLRLPEDEILEAALSVASGADESERLMLLRRVRWDLLSKEGLEKLVEAGAPKDEVLSVMLEQYKLPSRRRKPAVFSQAARHVSLSDDQAAAVFQDSGAVPVQPACFSNMSVSFTLKLESSSGLLLALALAPVDAPLPHELRRTVWPVWYLSSGRTYEVRRDSEAQNAFPGRAARRWAARCSALTRTAASASPSTAGSRRWSAAVNVADRVARGAA
eukprot:TRINITY_DN13029_c0_g1_i1.p1 TRINITY_DN13029_c0_g1~~TRINITY_DN13029_c0_g1_i1.p1  ORF type:complete len:441 (+),score=79.65 TRINITY_DN13029_c0_g1_i1:46-1368(+)